MEFFHKGIDPA